MTLKILAIDDSRTIREMLRHALGNAGFEVHLADDGVAGIEALDHCHPDLVITDINMPFTRFLECANSYLAAYRCIFDGIIQQISECLKQHIPVGHYNHRLID